MMTPEEISIRAVAFAQSIRKGRVTLERVEKNVKAWATQSAPLATSAEVREILKLVREQLTK